MILKEDEEEEVKKKIEATLKEVKTEEIKRKSK